MQTIVLKDRAASLQRKKLIQGNADLITDSIQNDNVAQGSKAELFDIGYRCLFDCLTDFEEQSEITDFRTFAMQRIKKAFCENMSVRDLESQYLHIEHLEDDISEDR